jgi:hypothetical protein
LQVFVYPVSSYHQKSAMSSVTKKKTKQKP